MSIYEKLAKIQEELKAPKTEFNSFGKFSYRTAENILQAVKPIAKKNDCVLILTDTVEMVGEKYFIKSIAELISFDFVPNDDKNTKSIATMGWAEIPSGKRGMDQAQECGTATSYARKYALGALFGITNEKDSDAYDNTKADREAEKEQAIKSNEEKLNASENWRLVNGNHIEVKTNGGKWIDLENLELRWLEVLLKKPEFADITNFIQMYIDKIKNA